MGLITFKHSGSFKNTENFFDRALRRDYLSILNRYGQMGVDILKNATPVNSGKTADLWSYEISTGNGTVSISWNNSNENQGYNIVILIVYGHGLRNGGYVSGNDFVHPSIRPVMDELAQKVWGEVTK